MPDVRDVTCRDATRERPRAVQRGDAGRDEPRVGGPDVNEPVSSGRGGAGVATQLRRVASRSAGQRRAVQHRQIRAVGGGDTGNQVAAAGKILGQHWTDTSRLDPLATTPDRWRELSVWLWYPATRDARGQPALYAPGLWQQLHFPGPLGLFEGPFDRVRPAARDGAPVASGRFPVVVLEPGLGFSAPQ